MSEMNEQEMRIAIAEGEFDAIKRQRGLVAWQRTDSTLLYGGCDSKGLWIWKDKEGQFFGMNYDTLAELERGEINEIAKRKDYPNDLNAIQAACLQIGQVRLSTFSMELRAIVLRDNKDKELNGRLTDFWFYNATAKQRCEAFLKTLNLWKK